jgi:hypothetical protein
MGGEGLLFYRAIKLTASRSQDVRERVVFLWLFSAHFGHIIPWPPPVNIPGIDSFRGSEPGFFRVGHKAPSLWWGKTNRCMALFGQGVIPSRHYPDHQPPVPQPG